MLPSHSHSSAQAAREIVRFNPPIFNPSFPYGPTALIQATNPAENSSIYGTPLDQFTEVRLHFTGPVTPYIHGGIGVLPLSPYIAARVEFSWQAHVRRFRERGQNPALTTPTIPMEGIQIDLSYVDLWVETRMIEDTPMFLEALGILTPPRIRGDEDHGALEWDIVCPNCGAAVTHYVFDKHWNGRYLDHRRSSRCMSQEPKPQVEAAYARSGRGVQGVDRRIAQ